MDCLLSILEVSINVIQNYHDYSTRNSERLTSEIRHTTQSGFMVKHVGVDIWSSIPESIR